MSEEEAFKPERVFRTWKDAELEEAAPGELSLFQVKESQELLNTVMVPLTQAVTEVPDGKKLVPVVAPKDVDVWSFKAALAGAFQAYLESGRLEPDRIARLSGVQLAVVEKILTTQEFAFALACRGIDPEGRGLITAQQDAALMILTDIGSNKTWGQKLKEAGITQAIFTAWLRNPTFANRWQQLTEEIASNHNVALVQLGQKAGEGDMRAVELQLAVAGRYSASQQANIDIMVMMNKMVEILARHLSNQPELMRAIAVDLREVSEQISLGNQRAREVGHATITF